MPIDYLNAWPIIGQKRIKKRLGYILTHICEGGNENVLFRAPSGYGKTYLAHACCEYIDYKLKEDTYYFYLGNNAIDLSLNRRIHLLDEIHMTKNPEFLYRYMESSENYSFFLCTNEFQELKEPLVNRCIQLTFESYSFAELKIIARLIFEENEVYGINTVLLSVIIKRARGSPREVGLMCRQLTRRFNQDGIPNNIRTLENILSDIDVEEGGLSAIDNKYLEFLMEQGVVGLKTISLVLNLPEKYVREEIEPFLVRKGRIRITPRGRILC
ncbi:hypothetical protein LCGC14_1318630 [marine sediment metagenome]|uniref:RuvB winged helix C-terminal domain-containing protein n=1 Tax=marine sediment metagenome TaxID=412755 RepID=A0A0F9N0Z8_9ZZZZ